MPPYIDILGDRLKGGRPSPAAPAPSVEPAAPPDASQVLLSGIGLTASSLEGSSSPRPRATVQCHPPPWRRRLASAANQPHRVSLSAVQSVTAASCGPRGEPTRLAVVLSGRVVRCQGTTRLLRAWRRPVPSPAPPPCASRPAFPPPQCVPPARLHRDVHNTTPFIAKLQRLDADDENGGYQ